MALTNRSFRARHLIALLFAGMATEAFAAERDFCPERPGLNTPPCIVDAGHVVAEASALDWTLDRQSGARTDTVLIGDVLLRLGLTNRLEGQVGWTAYGHVRVRGAAGVSEHSGMAM